MTTDTTITYPDGLPDPVAPLGDKAAGWFRTLLIVVGVSWLALVVGAFTEPKQFLQRVGVAVVGSFAV